MDGIDYSWVWTSIQIKARVAGVASTRPGRPPGGVLATPAMASNAPNPRSPRGHGVGKEGDSAEVRAVSDLCQMQEANAVNHGHQRTETPLAEPIPLSRHIAHRR